MRVFLRPPQPGTRLAWYLDGAGPRQAQAAKLRAAQEREERIRAALAQLPEVAAAKKRNGAKAEDARASTTDADARVMKMGDGGFRPAYNMQLATECEGQVIVGMDVVNANVLAAIGYTKKDTGVTGHGLRVDYVCRRLIEFGVDPVVRVTRADCDRWAAMGNAGWSADDVMPLFQALERSGASPATRPRPTTRFVAILVRCLPIREVRHVHPLTDAFIQAAQAAGFPRTSDYNGAQQEGVGYGQFNQRGGCAGVRRMHF